MNGQIAVAYPDFLQDLLNMENEEFTMQIKLLSLVKLYELGKISSGKAAKVLGISRISFLDILGLYHVSCFADESDLESDIRNASLAAEAHAREVASACSL